MTVPAPIRWIAVAVMALASFGLGQTRAEHGPDFAITCPVGRADIVLDPGHGGSDPGAIHEPTGLIEARLNLEIAQIAAEMLRANQGYTVALTRTDDATELGNSERGAFANACQATVFVEVHLNWAADPDVNYARSYWGEKEKDIAFSLIMNNALMALGIPVSPVERFDNGGLLRAKMPSVLVEAVFLSNPAEATALRTEDRARAIAEAIVAGIVTWPGLDPAGQ
jgi:N-acetylmuramoyl-L-alanine amidase